MHATSRDAGVKGSKRNREALHTMLDTVICNDLDTSYVIGHMVIH